MSSEKKNLIRDEKAPPAEPSITKEELSHLLSLYPFAEGYVSEVRRFSCGALPVNNTHVGKSLHVKRDGTPLYPERWDEVSRFDSATQRSWVRRDQEAFQIDTSGKIISGPHTAYGTNGVFTLAFKA